MRLFTALDLPAEVAGNLEDLLRRLRPTARIRWSPPENLHITTKFIGEWPEARLDELKSALAAIPARAPIAMRIHNLGFFPNARAPRIFWCGIDAPGLAGLAEATDGATAALGIARETRPFSPHLTLGRIKDRVNIEALNQAIAGLASAEFGCFEARSFFLYLSQLRPSGSVYTKLAELPLSL
jgi:2'-5' RNA ligase